MASAVTSGMASATGKVKVKAAILGAWYAVPLEALRPKWEQREWFTKMHVTPKGGNKYGACATEDQSFWLHARSPKFLYLPRFYGQSVFVADKVKDIRWEGQPLAQECAFTSQLRPATKETPAQQEAADQVLHELRRTGGAMLELPCGFGKTVVSLYIAASLGRRTLVVVNTTTLLEQWVERIQQFLPAAAVGVVVQDRVQVDNDVVVCMLQTLRSRKYGPDVLQGFGTVILDEAHHIAAREFSKIMRLLPCRYVLGLSATPDRNDGLGFVLNWLMGKTAYTAKRVANSDVTVRMIKYTQGFQGEIMYKNGQIGSARMLTTLSKDPKRTVLMVDTLHKVLVDEPDRQVLVLSDRRELLRDLNTQLSALGYETQIMVGGSTTKKKKELNVRAHVLLSTYPFCAEGFDQPWRDTLVLATPRSNIEQSLGRILRKHAHKKQPLVLDFVDPFSIFFGMQRKRHKFYKSLGYSVEQV